MPGTPPTSPRFDVPRYADTDVAEFSSQVNAITDTIDAAVAKRLVPNLLSASGTGADHQVIVAAANEIVTLPTPSSEYELICVYAKDDSSGVSGSAPVTVQVTSGSKIYGKGLGVSGVTSFLLGTPGAFAWLFSYDGTNWRIVHGAQDTGWVACTLPAGCASYGDTLAARKIGDMIDLKGGVQDNTGGTVTTVFTLPAFAAPSAQRLIDSTSYYDTTAWRNPAPFIIGAGSTAVTQAQSGTLQTNGTILTFDGVRYAA